MASPFYILLKSSEDGNPVTILNDTTLQDLLDDPEAEYGIKVFHNASWLGANQDHNYWHDDHAVLIKCEVVIPEPSGKYVLPKETND
jgi:hypothetical protein